MPPLGVTVYVVPGDPETGQWCEVCLLPSAVLVPIFTLYEGPVITLFGRCLYCPQCMDKPRWVG